MNADQLARIAVGAMECVSDDEVMQKELATLTNHDVNEKGWLDDRAEAVLVWNEVQAWLTEGKDVEKKDILEITAALRRRINDIELAIEKLTVETHNEELE